MAKDLIETMPGAPEGAKRAARQEKTSSLHSGLIQTRQAMRPLLPFRAVNLRDKPGYDPGLQRHHLLPRQLLTKRCFDRLFEEIGRVWRGFDDFRSNGMLLPACDATALRIGLPLHRGPHREYNAMVIERVGEVEAIWSNARRRASQDAGGNAVTQLGGVQRDLRHQLLDPGKKRLALNRNDPLARGIDFAGIDGMADALWPAGEPWAAEALAIVDQVAPWAGGSPVRAARSAFA